MEVSIEPHHWAVFFLMFLGNIQLMGTSVVRKTGSEQRG